MINNKKEIKKLENELLNRISLYIELDKLKNKKNYLIENSKKKYKQKIQILTYYKPFIDSVISFRRRWLPDGNHFEILRDCFRWAKELKDTAKYENDLNYFLEYGIRDKKISQRWKKIIEYYILTGRLNLDSLLPHAIEIKLMPRTEDNKPGIFIEIYPETELRDLKESWKTIEGYQIWHKQISDNQPLSGTKENEYWNFIYNCQWRHNVKYQKLILSKDNILRNTKLYGRAYELKQQKKSMKEIRDTLREENLLNDDGYDTPEISKLIKRFENALRNTELN